MSQETGQQAVNYHQKRINFYQKKIINIIVHAQTNNLYQAASEVNELCKQINLVEELNRAILEIENDESSLSHRVKVWQQADEMIKEIPADETSLFGTIENRLKHLKAQLGEASKQPTVVSTPASSNKFGNFFKVKPWRANIPIFGNKTNKRDYIPNIVNISAETIRFILERCQDQLKIYEETVIDQLSYFLCYHSLKKSLELHQEELLNSIMQYLVEIKFPEQYSLKLKEIETKQEAAAQNNIIAEIAQNLELNNLLAVYLKTKHPSRSQTAKLTKKIFESLSNNKSELNRAKLLFFIQVLLQTLIKLEADPAAQEKFKKKKFARIMLAGLLNALAITDHKLKDFRIKQNVIEINNEDFSKEEQKQTVKILKSSDQILDAANKAYQYLTDRILHRQSSLFKKNGFKELLNSENILYDLLEQLMKKEYEPTFLKGQKHNEIEFIAELIEVLAVEGGKKLWQKITVPDSDNLSTMSDETRLLITKIKYVLSEKYSRESAESMQNNSELKQNLLMEIKNFEPYEPKNSAMIKACNALEIASKINLLIALYQAKPTKPLEAREANTIIAKLFNLHEKIDIGRAMDYIGPKIYYLLEIIADHYYKNQIPRVDEVVTSATINHVIIELESGKYNLKQLETCCNIIRKSDDRPNLISSKPSAEKCFELCKKVLEISDSANGDIVLAAESLLALFKNYQNANEFLYFISLAITATQPENKANFFQRLSDSISADERFSYLDLSSVEKMCELSELNSARSYNPFA